MSKWKFQILPNTPDILGKGYRLDPVSQQFEIEVADALPYHFRFHKISKLVIGLGAHPTNTDRDYYEVERVAVKEYPKFDLKKHSLLDDIQKRESLKAVVSEVFSWLCDEFEDAQCFCNVLAKLNWR